MQHLTEDQLVLYHYGELAECAAVEQHLADCASCRASYEMLQDVLGAVEAAPVPERPETYGAMVWARLRRDIARPAPAGFFAWPRWAVAAAMGVLIVAAFLAGRFWPRSAAPTIATAGQIRERILLVAVGDHLERSQMVLVELVNAKGNGAVDISNERQWAEDLLDSNRLYRQTAAGIGETALASVLDDLERVLLEVAHSPSRLSSRDLDELRRRIESEGILFKIRVIGSKVQAQEQGGTGRGRL